MSVQTELRDLRTAVENNRTDEIVDIIAGLFDEFSRQLEEQRRLTELAQFMKSNSDGTPEDRANQYLITSSKATMSRSSVSVSIKAYLDGKMSKQGLLESIDGAINLHSSLEQRKQNLLDTSSVADLPPLLYLSGSDELEAPKGKKTTGTMTLHNLGNDPITGISIKSHGELEIEVQPEAISNLPPGDGTDIQLQVSTSELGEHSGEITADADNVDDDKQVKVIVADKKEYLEVALDQTKSVQQQLNSALENEKENTPPQNVLENIIQSTEKIISDSESPSTGKGKSKNRTINNKIDSVINKLGTFRNLLDKWGNKGGKKEGKGGNSKSSIDQTRAANLRHDAGQVVVTLETAKEAAQ